jgi:hypothetical protein
VELTQDGEVELELKGLQKGGEKGKRRLIVRKLETVQEGLKVSRLELLQNVNQAVLVVIEEFVDLGRLMGG